MELEQIRAGDSEALGLLLRESWAPLVLYLTAFLGSIEAAEDAAQEAFVRLWEHRERWTSGSARAVLFRIGRNAALDIRRRDSARRRWERRRPIAVTSPSPTPEEVLLGSELLVCFREAVESLPPRRREVFELIRLRGLSHGEAAEVLGLSYRTVANHLRLAMKDLKNVLTDGPTDDQVELSAHTDAGRGRGESDG